VLRRIFGPKKNEVTGGCGKLHKEVHYLYSLPSIIKNDQIEKDEMGGACSPKKGKEKCV
jgi:hypothetical protein